LTTVVKFIAQLEQALDLDMQALDGTADTRTSDEHHNAP
jgi:hypothetical protein